MACFLWSHGDALAETMYVTDRLYLSLRSAPDPGGPRLTLLPSDTRVDVIETEGNWAKVLLEDGKTGWVLKRYLVTDVPKTTIIEQLRRQIDSKDISVKSLREENASLKAEIEGLKNEIVEQNARIEVTTKENTAKRLKEMIGTGISALLVGLIIGLALGYLARRPKKIRY
jgi:SH3 domain protein